MAVRGLSDSGDYAYVLDNAAHDITGDYLSIACWFRPHVLDGNGRALVAKWDGTDNAGSAYLLYINLNVLRFLIQGAGQDAVSSPTVLTTERWYHTVAVKTPTGMAIYLNGKLDAVAASTNQIQNSAKNFFLMVYANATACLNGGMADIGLWDVSLNPDEVSRLSRGLRAKYVRPGSLRGYWPFKSSVAATQFFRDESKYANHALAETASHLNAFQDPPQLDSITSDELVQKIKKPGTIVRASIFRGAKSRRNNIEGCRFFPGSSANQLMYIASPPTELQLTGDYGTIMCWTRTGAVASGGQLFDHSDGGALRWDMYHQSGHLECRINNGGTDTCTGTTSLITGSNLDKWHHVVMRKNGSGADALQILLNGKVDGTVTSSRSFPGGTNNFCLGNRGQADSPWTGRIAEFAVWGAALTNEEIQRIYMGENPLNVRPGQLRGYWPLNDSFQLAGADTSMDRSRYANHLLVWGGSIAIPLSNSFRDTPGQEFVDLPMFGGEADLGAIALTQVLVTN